MRIGILCGEYPPSNHGGIGSFTKDLAEGLTQHGHNVYVFGIYYDMYLKIEDQIDEVINNVNVIRIPFKKYTGNSYFDEVLNRLFLRNFTKKLILHKSLEVLEVYDSTGMLPFKMSIPMVTRLHGSVTYFGEELRRPYSKFISFFEKSQIKNSRLLIGVSQYVLNQTIKYFSIKPQGAVIYNCVKHESKAPIIIIDSNDFVLYFGSIHPKKGVEQLAKSMNIVFEAFPHFSLLMIGKSFRLSDGVEYTSYLKSMLKPDFQEKIRFMDHMNRDELSSYISGSYCCVFPSFAECFSLTPMEAMSLGKPVVYSTLHSGPELIVDGHDGFLVDPHNVEQIAAKIIYLIENPDIASEIGTNGQNTIRTRFNYENWLIENERTYKNLLDNIDDKNFGLKSGFTKNAVKGD